jgi:cytochrome c-type biogenesis protein CcmH/NrfG
MLRAEQAEAQAVRNVAEAIERTLRDAPNPASEAVLWAALGPLGVTRAQFDRALWTLEVRRVARRADGRVFSGKGN